MSETTPKPIRLIVVSGRDHGQREAYSVFYAGYYLLTEGADLETVRYALANNEEPPPASGVYLSEEEVSYVTCKDDDHVGEWGPDDE